MTTLAQSQIHMAGPSITQVEIDAVMDAMTTGWYEKPYWYVEEFQRVFAAWHGRQFGIMTPNCTTSIHLIMTALGIGPGDEVIVPECTWIASAAPISYLGATPVFCDIDPVSWCLDPASVRAAITPRTKAIVAVDLFGNMPNLPALQQIADEVGIPLLEDAAEAVGSVLDGKRAGSFGIASFFSFHRTKTITTGEGGMLLLDDAALASRCMILRDHGRRPGGAMYVNEEVTYKYMPFNVQAALGYAQFQRVDELVRGKRDILRWFREELVDVPDIQLNPEPFNGVNGAWITGMVLGHSYGRDKAWLMARMQELGLPVRPFFYPLSSLPAYPGMRERYEARNPTAYDVSSRGVNLPGALNLTRQDAADVGSALRRILHDAR
jgi:perosamine synthetase